MSDFDVRYWPNIVDIRLFVADTVVLNRIAHSTDTDLSTGEIAELLGVHASTVKRWFRGGARAGGRGRVPTTAGGHRRVSLDLALRVARDRGHEVYLHRFDSDAVRVWRAIRELGRGRVEPAQDLLIAWLRERRTRLIGRFLRHLATVDAPVDPAVLDGVFGGFMRRVGDAWANGDLRISDERAATREVSEAIYALLDSLDRAEHEPDPGSPTAVVATVEPDQHILGSLLVRLVLAQRGWNVEHLGTGLPIAEIVAIQRALGASLICVSFTPPRGTADVHRLFEVAGSLSDPCHPCSLLVGGSAAQGARLPARHHPFSDLRILASLAELSDWLEEHRHA